MTDSGDNRNLDSREFLLSLVVAKDGEVFADSRQVGTRFGKRHDNVMRDIEKISSNLSRSPKPMFFKAELPDSYGRMQPAYEMTEEGFTLLVMGFTGEEAMSWKLRYIRAFNLMRAELLNRANRRQAVRQDTKKRRNELTAALKSHGVTEPREYAIVTNNIYVGLTDKTAAQLKKDRNLAPKANLRDSFTEIELVQTMLSEMLTSEVIETEDQWGVGQCSRTARHCATSVRKGVANARKTQKKLT